MYRNINSGGVMSKVIKSKTSKLPLGAHHMGRTPRNRTKELNYYKNTETFYFYRYELVPVKEMLKPLNLNGLD